MSWYDEGMRLRVRVSTAGDFVKLGKSTVYPFTDPTSGIPNGWTQFLGMGGASGDVSWTTAYGRFSVGNIGTDIHNTKLYGIYRNFTVPTGKRWLIQVRCRTTAARTTAIRYVAWGTGVTATYNSQVWSYGDWEQVSIYTGVLNSTNLALWLYAAPYTQSTIHDPADAKWGIQFTNVTLVEMEPSYPAPTWSTITCDVHSFMGRWGRDRFVNRYDVASASLEIINDIGDFTYGLSSYWGLRPGRFLKVEGYRPPPNQATVYPLYYGIIDSLTDSFSLDGHAVTKIECVDVSSLLSNITVPTYSDEGEYFQSGYRFRSVAYSAGWHPSYLSYDPGVYTQQAILANGRTVRDELGLIADSEGGAFFADRSGYLNYYDRNWEKDFETLKIVQAELSALPNNDNLPVVDMVPTDSKAPIIPLRAVHTEWSRDRVVNEVTIANQGGTSVTTIDFDSQAKYGPRTFQRLDFVNDDRVPEYITERTQDVMIGYTDAILRVNGVEFSPQPSAYLFTLLVFLNWLVRVRYEHPTEGWGFSVVTHVQGIAHEWTTGSLRVSLNLDKPTAFSYWQRSSVGWDDGLWDTAKWDDID